MWRWFNWNGLSDTNRIKAFAELAMVEFSWKALIFYKNHFIE
jgi:hypothetical protein